MISMTTTQDRKPTESSPPDYYRAFSKISENAPSSNEESPRWWATCDIKKVYYLRQQ